MVAITVEILAVEVMAVLTEEVVMVALPEEVVMVALP